MNPSMSSLDASIFRHAPFGVAVISSTSGSIDDANEAYCALLGVARDRLVGNCWMKYTHPDDIARDVMCVLDMKKNGKSRVMREKRYIRPDGSVVHARVSLSPLETGSDYPAHLAMVENLTSLYDTCERMKDCVHQVRMNREAIFDSLAVVAQFRDRETGEHLKRTEAYVRMLLENMGQSSVYSSLGIRTIAHASILHDIGKVGIPDSILLKEGLLTGAEYTIMETHTTLGEKAIRATMEFLPNDTTLMYAKDIAEYHHERWDGKGYPAGLKGEQIPLPARVMALADVYDALRSERVYKEAYNHEDSVKLILAERGTHFDPAIVDAFLRLENRFRQKSMYLT